MLTSVRPWLAFAMVFILTAFSRPQVGDLVELEQLINGRAQARFRPEDRNLIRLLTPGTKALIEEVKLFYSGNYGLRIQLIQPDGSRELQEFWVYYNVKSPALKLFEVSGHLGRKQEILSNWNQNPKFEPATDPTQAATAIVKNPINAFMTHLANQSPPAAPSTSGASKASQTNMPFSNPTYVFIGGMPTQGRASQTGVSKAQATQAPKMEPVLSIDPSQLVAALSLANEGSTGTGPIPSQEVGCLRTYDTRVEAAEAPVRAERKLPPAPDQKLATRPLLTTERFERDLKTLKNSLEKTANRAQALELLDAYQSTLSPHLDQLMSHKEQQDLYKRVSRLHVQLELLKKSQCPGAHESLNGVFKKVQDQDKGEEASLKYALELADLVCAKK